VTGYPSPSMAEGIVYLDVDDEITSAASRIRTSPSTKVALVVPYGSRIATSRMNFRLLSREALVSNRRLSIVSGDAAARSLAASAGLPVFATVGEYESSVAERSPAGAEATPPQPGADVATGPITAISGVAAAEGLETSLARSETVVAATPAARVAEDVSPAPITPPRKSQRSRRPLEDAPAAVPARALERSAPTADETADDGPFVAGLPPLFGTRIRAPVAAAVGLVALALIVLAVGAYVFLPAATISLVARREPIGPLPLTIAADPAATSVDPVGLVVPAVRVDVPVEASQTFTTSGVRVDQTPATGTVTFENYNFLGSDTVPAGSVVSTEGGIKFRTLASITLPAADFVIPSVIPSRKSVNVQALKDGPDGNVPANTIRVVPQGENPESLKVNNPAPTSGGTRTETPQVKKAEVDKAVAAVQADLERAFQDAVAAGANAPPGTTLFPATARLGPATPAVDPQSFVGQEVPSFEIRLTADGTVIAVDPGPVRSIAESQIASHVAADHQLVPGSTVIDVGEGVVGEDGQVSFLATARATQVAVVDPAALRDLVKGKTAAAAVAALDPYGTATVTLWPDWASTVTSMDARLTITVDTSAAATGGGSPAPSGSRAPGTSPSRRPAPTSTSSAGPS
jgi:hypothetical protein